MQALDGEEITLEEVVELAAVDGNFYARTFFPKTARQESPAFHKEMDTVLENPANRFVGFEVFRGGAKTTKLRLFASKRIAYGISHTIIFVGKSQDHAVKSIHWLKQAVEYNTLWARTFGLRKGKKWTDSEIEIIHGTDEYPIRVIALGITGSVRGINVDDYRPDLIILDDPCHKKGTQMWEAGRWFPVEEHVNAREEKTREGLTVRLDGLPQAEVVTTDHKYWVAQAVKARDKSSNLKVTAVTNGTWVEAKDLTEDSYIGTPIPDEIIESGWSADMCYIIGLWWGDGDLSGNGCTIRWSVSDKAVEARLISALTAEGFSINKIFYSEGCWRIAIGCTELWKLLKSWHLGNSIKQLPEEFLYLPYFQQFRLMQGYIDADGCINGERTGVRLASKYYEGLVFTSWILARLGIRSTLRRGRPGGIHIILGREVNAEQQWELGFTDQATHFVNCGKPKRHFTKCFIQDGFLWRRVKTVVSAGLQEFIPLSTEGSQYLTAQGLSHNCDEENTATAEAREKISDLVFGALSKTLAPASEAPDATMALAQTVLVQGDLIDRIMVDPQWASVRYSCFDSRGESAWPERWSTEELLADKAAHVNRNQLSLWLREMECQLVNQENAAFLLRWLGFWDVLPPGGLTYIGIDPTPPPKDGNALKQVNLKLDDAVIMVIKFHGGKVYVVEYYDCKSPDPEEFVNKIFEMVARHNPMMVGVETTMFQRMLKWYIDREMLRRRQFFTVVPVEDKRKKETRIVQTITRYASNGGLLIHKDHTKLHDQYATFQAQATRQHDDFLDALTIAIDLINPGLEGATLEGDFTDITDESNIPELDDWRGAP